LVLSSGTAARAQEPGRVYRLGVLFDAARDDPGIVASLLPPLTTADYLHQSRCTRGASASVSNLHQLDGRDHQRWLSTHNVAAHASPR